MPYVFEDPKLFLATSFTPNEQQLANTIVNYWATFHRTGNPNADGGSNEGDEEAAFHWPRYSPLAHNAIVLNHTPGLVKDWDQQYCQLWEQIISTSTAQ